MIEKPIHKARVRQARHTGKPFACLTHAFLPTLIAFVLTMSANGQIPVIETPKPATFDNPVTIGTPNSNYLPNQTQTNGMTDIQRRNQALINEVDQHQKHLATSGFYSNSNSPTIKYDLPDLSSMRGTEYFHSALTEVNKMLTGEKPLDLKKAVYTVENAYFEGQLNFNDFEKSIQNAVEICKMKLAEYNSSEINDFVINQTILSYFADTTVIEMKGLEKTLTHYPIKYDFEDYMGNDSWSNMFVSKLMATNSGQCHSMPLLFLIIAQELGSNAYLTHSPNHSFIRYQTPRGVWYNAEMTTGAIMTDAAYMESGYIKTEAIQSGIYMDTLSNHETVACMLNTLSLGYTRKYGYDSFVKQCSDTIAKYYPNQLNAVMLEANYQTQKTMYIARQKNMPVKEFVKDPMAKTEFEKMHEAYAKIDALGYEFMPEEQYIRWLKRLEEAKLKAENQKGLIHQIVR